MNQQLDVANHFMSAQQYPQAANAYELFIKHYGNYEYIGDIRLMLGLIFSRYLHQDEKAQTYLSAATTELLDKSKIELARNELTEVRKRLG